MHIQASCALRQFCDYSGQAILAVCRAADCERREEDICSWGDLLQLSEDFCGSCSLTLSSWFKRSAGAQSVIIIKGPIQQNTWHYIVYTLSLHLQHQAVEMWCSLHSSKLCSYSLTARAAKQVWLQRQVASSKCIYRPHLKWPKPIMFCVFSHDKRTHIHRGAHITFFQAHPWRLFWMQQAHQQSCDKNQPIGSTGLASPSPSKDATTSGWKVRQTEDGWAADYTCSGIPVAVPPVKFFIFWHQQKEQRLEIHQLRTRDNCWYAVFTLTLLVALSQQAWQVRNLKSTLNKRMKAVFSTRF